MKLATIYCDGISKYYGFNAPLAPLGLDPCAHSPARAHGGNAGGGDSAAPRALTLTSPRLSTSGTARQPPVAERSARPASPLATCGAQPARAAPLSAAWSDTASAPLAPLGLDPYARSPVRARGNGADGSDGSDPHALAQTLVRLTASDAPSPLGLLGPPTSAQAPPPGSPMAHRRHHTTCPPIASPRDSAGDSDSAAPRPLTPTSPRPSASGTPSPLGPLVAHVGGGARPPGPHMAHQQEQQTTAPPMAALRTSTPTQRGDVQKSDDNSVQTK